MTLFTFLLIVSQSLSQNEPDSVETIRIRKEIQEEIIDMCEDEATFPEGVNFWLGKHLVYPQTALERGMQGKVYVNFIVEKDGSVTNAKVVRGIPDCPECDAEALRVIQIMPAWNAGRVSGKSVRSRIMIPINFTLM